jgi:hypothetical protein
MSTPHHDILNYDLLCHDIMGIRHDVMSWILVISSSSLVIVVNVISQCSKLDESRLLRFVAPSLNRGSAEKGIFLTFVLRLK